MTLWLSLEEHEMPGKVRPFYRPYEFCGQTIPVRGSIEGQRFVIAADLLPIIEAEATEIGEDDRGPFAILEENEWSLPDGTVVKVEHEYEEPWPNGYTPKPGLMISKVEPESPRKVGAVEVEVLIQTGIPPGMVNLVGIGPKWSCSVHFNSIGHLDGIGMSDKA